MYARFSSFFLDTINNFQVHSFLRGQGMPGEKGFAQLSLADVRSKFQNNSDEMERLKVDVLKKREAEKTAELRQLKQKSKEILLKRDGEQGKFISVPPMIALGYYTFPVMFLFLNFCVAAEITRLMSEMEVIN
jgi:hypothetical protein